MKSIFILLVCVLLLSINSQEQQPDFIFDCSKQCGKEMSCFGQDNICVPQYCTISCEDSIIKTSLDIDPNDWQDFVAMKETFSKPNQKAVTGNCTELAAFRHNVVSWGYNVTKIIDDREKRIKNVKCLDQKKRR